MISLRLFINAKKENHIYMYIKGVQKKINFCYAIEMWFTFKQFFLMISSDIISC